MEALPISFAIFTFAISILLATLPKCFSQENDTYSVCNQPYNCGSLTNIFYPFWGRSRPRYCGSGGFQLKCSNDQNTSIQVGSQIFNVLEINQAANTIRVARTDLAYDDCSSEFTNTSLNGSFLQYLPSAQNLTIFYNCSSEVSVVRINNFTCRNDNNSHAFYVNGADKLQQLSGRCGVRVEVPVRGNISEGTGLKKALEEGFEVQYIDAESVECSACGKSGGICGSRVSNTFQFLCHCPGGTHDTACPSGRRNSQKSTVLKLVLGFVCTAIGLPLIAVAICRNKEKIWLIISRRFGNVSKNDKNIESFLQSEGPLPLKRYSFSDLKKMTESFKAKLGQGGYGSVYKGELLDGRSIAVKILNESKENGEEFMNEVASISRTSHVNVVSLLGFCLEGRRKALVYEFMANGSLEKFTQNKVVESSTPRSLSWENLYQIAIGIARGLEYLHKGCNTRILHFDIKPHNILLDENFRPKISDFGLAKLNKTEESIISMSNARGTLGYVAPEVWNKSFGGVSHKSDVYSYGMMLLEMVGGQKNINVEASRTSETYFPHLLVYKKLKLGSDFELNEGISSGENEIAKRMTMVGMWCIQSIPAHRPTISRVIEMLEGCMDSLQMPPKPVMSSPPRSAAESSSSFCSLQSV